MRLYSVLAILTKHARCLACAWFSQRSRTGSLLVLAAFLCDYQPCTEWPPKMPRFTAGVKMGYG